MNQHTETITENISAINQEVLIHITETLQSAAAQPYLNTDKTIRLARVIRPATVHCQIQIGSAKIAQTC